MFSVGARIKKGEPDLPSDLLTQRIQQLCGAGVLPHLHDDGGFTIECATEAEARQIQAVLDGKFNMRDRKPWKVEG